MERLSDRNFKRNGRSTYFLVIISPFGLIEAISSRTWAIKQGDGELTWGRALRHIAVFAHLSDLAFLIPTADPRLTPIGEGQARSAHTAWEREILRGLPVPQRFYCSPLTRAICTLQLTFEGIIPPDLKPLILEVTSFMPSCTSTNLVPGSELP